MQASEQEELLFRQLEERLLLREGRSSPETVSALLAAEFVEFGRSGSVFNRQSVIEALQEEEAVERTMSDFSVRRLAQGVALVTYRSTRRDPEGGKDVHSLRSSIWKLIDGRWQMIFHQGTPTRPR
jgi:hypothetical protein